MAQSSDPFPLTEEKERRTEAPDELAALLHRHAGFRRIAPWIAGPLALVASGVLAYFCWLDWLPRLWGWGFAPPTWRGIFSLLGALYLVIGPVVPLVMGWRVIVQSLQAQADHAPGEPERRAIARAMKESRERWSRGRLRLALVIFVVLPLIIALLAVAVYLSVAENRLTLRWSFLLVVILLPAVLYYLFNVSRRYSVLTDLLSNLNRVGLLTVMDDSEEERARQRRVLGYIQKFEATYGPLTDPDRERVKTSANLTDPLEPMAGSEDKSAFSDVLTETRIPVFIATALIAIGWATALPPFEPARMDTAPAPEIRVDRAVGENAATPPNVSDESAVSSGEAPSQTGVQEGRRNDSPAADVDGGAISWGRQFAPDVGLISFAFLGAYFFSIQMLFRRYIRRDLNSSAYTSVSLRIILAVIGTWILFEGIVVLDDVDPRYRLALAFSVGLLPQIVIDALAQLAKRLTAWSRIMDGLTTSFPATRLDGLTIWHASRLEEEDVEDVYAMATADILDLMIRTRFHPERIVEWVDQALLYSQLSGSNSDLPEKLADAGVRTATGLLVSLDKERSELGKLFKSDEEMARLEIAGYVIRTKPNLQQILRWRGLPPDRFRPLEVSP